MVVVGSSPTRLTRDSAVQPQFLLLGELLLVHPSMNRCTFPADYDPKDSGTVVWVDSYEGGVYLLRPGGKSEKNVQLPEDHVSDSLKVDLLFTNAGVRSRSNGETDGGTYPEVCSD